jgi:hypothetical protein
MRQRLHKLFLHYAPDHRFQPALLVDLLPFSFVRQPVTFSIIAGDPIDSRPKALVIVPHGQPPPDYLLSGQRR